MSELRKEKKPPININELKKAQEGEEHEKGPLNYMDKNKNPGGGGGPPGTKQKINLTQLILAVGISILLFFVVAQFTLTSKSDAIVLLDNQILLESDQAATETSLNTQIGRIEALTAAQSSYALKSEVSGFAKTSDLTPLSSGLSSLNSWKLTIDKGIISLEDRISDVEDEVAVFGNQTDEGVGGSIDYYLSGNDLHVKVSRSGYYRFKLTLFETNSAYLISLNATTEVLEYYTKSHQLDAGEWISGNLDKVEEALEDEGLDLSDYQVMLEILAGDSEDTEEDGDSW